MCDDGKYRWRYDVNLFKNLSIFRLVWKILFFSFAAIFLFVIIADIINWGFSAEKAIQNLKIFAYVLIGITAISAVSYLIYAAIMGGKYCVVFEMDEVGINHRQTDNQAKKAKKLGSLTAAAGAASGSFSTMGVGINATRTELYSEFAKVKRVKCIPKRNTIKLNGAFNHNQVYAVEEDLEFVESFILSHCENLK